ncbi:MAG: hypothetical protein LBR80_15505 [Deltaproteobacteria bacterium]|jgi:hypothetical protein|nr:hypothetical protein [Deltaproteobacteria bacterium]
METKDGTLLQKWPTETGNRQKTKSKGIRQGKDVKDGGKSWSEGKERNISRKKKIPLQIPLLHLLAVI